MVAGCGFFGHLIANRCWWACTVTVVAPTSAEVFGRDYQVRVEDVTDTAALVRASKGPRSKIRSFLIVPRTVEEGQTVTFPEARVTVTVDSAIGGPNPKVDVTVKRMLPKVSTLFYNGVTPVALLVLVFWWHRRRANSGTQPNGTDSPSP